KLLRACGRLSVRTAMLPTSSRTTTGSFAAAGPLAGAEDWAFIGVGFRRVRPSPFYLAQRPGGASYRGTGRAPARSGVRTITCDWWRDGKEDGYLKEARRAQAPQPAAKRLVAPRGGDGSALVAARDRTQRCADPRQGRLHITRSQADRGVVEAV